MSWNTLKLTISRAPPSAWSPWTRLHYKSVSSYRLLAAPEIRNTVSNPFRRKHKHTAQNVIYVFLHVKRIYWRLCILNVPYTGRPGGNVPYCEKMFIKLKYTDITQYTYIRSWTVTEIMAREKCGLLAFPRTVPVSRDVLTAHCACPSLSLQMGQTHSRCEFVIQKTWQDRISFGRLQSYKRCTYGNVLR
jgi:hypothetical protein